MTAENIESHDGKHSPKSLMEATPTPGQQVLTGKPDQWQAELSHLLPTSSPSANPLTYRHEINASVHQYLQTDKNFAGLNQRLHTEHALKDNYKVVGVAVHNGLPELILVDKENQGENEKETAVRALAVSAENGKITGTFSKDAAGGLHHSAFTQRPGYFLPFPLEHGATIWRDRQGQGRIQEIDTPQGLREKLTYDYLGQVRRLELMIGSKPLLSYCRNDNGSYDAIGPRRQMSDPMVDKITVVDDRSSNTGKLIFSMTNGTTTKFMRPDGRVQRFDLNLIAGNQ